MAEKIIEGPGKFELMVALFDGKEVFFTLSEHGKIKVLISTVTGRISSVRRECWDIEGEILDDFMEHIRASYNSRTRTGEVEKISTRRGM
ncbi:MAG: hypothetical protein PHC97_02040 [Patescibacteria group bacterium]|nr:hypothetical protein [Patescibacteria group bacterium]